MKRSFPAYQGLRRRAKKVGFLDLSGSESGGRGFRFGKEENFGHFRVAFSSPTDKSRLIFCQIGRIVMLLQLEASNRTNKVFISTHCTNISRVFYWKVKMEKKAFSMIMNEGHLLKKKNWGPVRPRNWAKKHEITMGMVFWKKRVEKRTGKESISSPLWNSEHSLCNWSWTQHATDML